MEDFVKVLRTVEEPAVKLKRGHGGPHPMALVYSLVMEHLDASKEAIDEKCCRMFPSEPEERTPRQMESTDRMIQAKAAKRVK